MTLFVSARVASLSVQRDSSCASVTADACASGTAAELEGSAASLL
jgi:hypothetical protein